MSISKIKQALAAATVEIEAKYGKGSILPQKTRKQRLDDAIDRSIERAIKGMEDDIMRRARIDNTKSEEVIDIGNRGYGEGRRMGD